MTRRHLPGRLPLAALLAALAAVWGCDSSPTETGPGAPAALDIVSGDLQTQTVGTELAQLLVVRVTDDKDKPVEGQIVNFRVTAGNGTVFAGAALTDGNGEARERWTLGTVAGDTQRVEARAVDPSTGEALVFAQFRAVGTAGPAASLVAVGSTSRTGLPSLPLADSVAVFVRDAYGNPVAGQSVTWTVRQGGGSVSPTTSTTGANGVARAQWTLGPQFTGSGVLEAAAGPSLMTQFTANVQLPADAVVVKVSGDAQTGAAGQVLPQPLVVRVQRANGTPLAGIPVTFSLPAGSGSVNPSTAVSGADGTVSVNWTLGVGTGAMEAIASLPTGSNTSFTAQAVAGAPATLQKLNGDNQSRPVGTTLPVPLLVRVVDAFGNVVLGATVTWSAASGSVNPATSTTDANGGASTTYTLPSTPGTVSVQASVPGAQPVTFTATAVSTAVSMRVLAPLANAIAGDSLRVTVRVDSARASVASIVASASGRSVTLQPTATPGTVSGILLLGGTPRGSMELRVVGTTVAGDSSVVLVPFTHDARPSLTVTAPVTHTVARPQLRIDVDCTDDDPAGCASVVAQVTRADLGDEYQTVATGTTGIHASVSLAQFNGHQLYIRFRATDSRGQVRVTEPDTVFVESSTALTEVASAGSRVLDVDAGRVLFVDTAGALRIRSGDTETFIMASGSRLGRLHPQGAIFAGENNVFDWRSGTLVDLGTLNSLLSLVVEGNWAIWNNATALYRRDLTTGTHVQISSEAINWRNDVTAGGVVAFGTGRGTSGNGYDIYRYDAGGTTRLTSDADASFWNVYPLTDGTSFVYRKSVQTGSGVLQPGGIALWRDGTETMLSSTTRDVQPGVDYAVEGGWVAWTNADAGGIIQVYTRAPDGTVRRATSAGTASSIRALGPDGTLVYGNAGSVYALRAPYTGTPVRISSEWSGYAYDAYRIVDGDVLLFLGRTVFRALF